MSDAFAVSEQLWTIEQVSAFLQVKPSTIYNARRANAEIGAPPSIKIGRQLRFRPSAVLDWLSQREAAPLAHRPHKPRKKARRKAVTA